MFVKLKCIKNAFKRFLESDWAERKLKIYVAEGNSLKYPNTNTNLRQFSIIVQTDMKILCYESVLSVGVKILIGVILFSNFWPHVI